MYHATVQHGSRFRSARASATFATLMALQLGHTSALAGEAAPATASSIAEQLAEKAFALHEEGKYAEAIATYLKAYEASNAAVTLFNVATIYDRKLHERDLASEYYRRFLRSPDAEPDLVAKATARLTVLKEEAEAEARERAVAAREAPATQAPATAPSRTLSSAPDAVEHPPATGHALRIAGFAVGGLGVASVGVSLLLGALAKSKNDDANLVCDGSACRTVQGVTLAHEAGHLATASTIMFFGGLAAAGGGVAMVLLAPRSSRSVARVSLGAVAGGGVGVGVEGGF
jgi:tetratricopeptide (TPR) repeat protein